MFEEIDESRYAFAPMQVLPELYVDLDMQLLTARDDRQRWSALIAGTREVLDRFDHIKAPKIICATGEFVIEQLDQCVVEFRNCGAGSFADWLQDVVDILAAHQQLQAQCAKRIRRPGTDADTIMAVVEAADSLAAAAEYMAIHGFRAFPANPQARPDYRLMGHAGACLAIEIRRNPLRVQLGGVGGAAGSPEFNPYVASLYRLELVTHRRLYRLFYALAEHVGMDLINPHGLFDAPDVIDRREL
jgi:hypothetical protein